MDQAGIMRFLGQASDLPFAIRKLGLSATAGLVRTHLEEYGSKIAGRATASAHVLRSVRPKACAFPLYYRVHSTDINVLQQVFLSGDYDCAGFERGVEFVVDCGANIGCASAFFLNRYPGSCVVAIEAELGNFGICRQNLEPYGSRVRAIHGAVWPRSEPLIVVRGEPVEEWAFSVRPCRDGEPKEIDGISLNDVREFAKEADRPAEDRYRGRRARAFRERIRVMALPDQDHCHRDPWTGVPGSVLASRQALRI